jgi:hypothetical protein
LIVQQALSKNKVKGFGVDTNGINTFSVYAGYKKTTQTV